MSVRETIGNRIRTLREQQGLSLAELARRAGSQRQSVHAWELGQAKPTDETMLAVAKALGTSISFLYGETDHPGRPPEWNSPTGSPNIAHAKALEAAEALKGALELVRAVAKACES